MCGIYVQHRGLCTTYMCNMDSMSYIKHVTHKNYQNEYKTLEYHVTHKSEALKYLKISFPHTCTTGILCNIAYMDTNFKNDMIIYMLHVPSAASIYNTDSMSHIHSIYMTGNM